MSRPAALTLLLPDAYTLVGWQADRHEVTTTAVALRGDPPASLRMPLGVGIDIYRDVEGGWASDVWWAETSIGGDARIRRLTVDRDRDDELAGLAGRNLLLERSDLRLLNAVTGLTLGEVGWVEGSGAGDDQVDSFRWLSEAEWDRTETDAEVLSDKVAVLRPGAAGFVLRAAPADGDWHLVVTVQVPFGRPAVAEVEWLDDTVPPGAAVRLSTLRWAVVAPVAETRRRHPDHVAEVRLPGTPTATELAVAVLMPHNG